MLFEISIEFIGHIFNIYLKFSFVTKNNPNVTASDSPAQWKVQFRKQNVIRLRIRVFCFQKLTLSFRKSTY